MFIGLKWPMADRGVDFDEAVGPYIHRVPLCRQPLHESMHDTLHSPVRTKATHSDPDPHCAPVQSAPARSIGRSGNNDRVMGLH